MRAENPYIVGNPIRDQERFFGRQDIFREVLQVLRQRESNAIVLYGQRRIGKTSVLLQLQNLFARDKEFAPVYFDLQDKAAKSLSEVLFELSQHLSRVTSTKVAERSDFDRADDYFRSVFLPDATRRVGSGGLVLLFDEFDVLDSPIRTQASEAFFPYLRAWMLDVQKVKFVFVIGRRPEDLSIRTMSTFKGVQSTRVSFLSEKDAKNIVRQSEVEGSLTWNDSAVSRVLDLTHGHPYFTQLLCSVVWENAYESAGGNAPLISANEVESAVGRALKFGANAFSWLWDGLPPAERVVLAAMAEVEEEIITQDKLIETLNQSGVRLVARELEFAPETLIDWEVLIEADGAYRFAVPLLHRWIRANRPLRRVKEELDRLDPLADTLFQGGQGLYSTNNLDAAELQLRESLKINPNHLKARLLLGQVLLEKGKVAESVETFEVAYQYDERSARAQLIKSLLALAETYDEISQLSVYERILQIQGDQALAREKVRSIWIRRGETAQLQGHFEEALKAFEKIDDPQRIAKVHSQIREKKLVLDMQQAEVYESSGRWKSALDVLAELTSEYPESEALQARMKKARTRWHAERVHALISAEAEEDWEQVLTISDSLKSDFAGDFEIQAFEDRARSQLDLSHKVEQAVGALAQGKTDHARHMLSQVLAESPTHLQAAQKLIEATFGEVKITRPLSWKVWVPVGITSLAWMFIILVGVFIQNGTVWTLLFARIEQVSIEAIILAAILLAGLIGTGVTLYISKVIDAAFRVQTRVRPSYSRALWTHVPLGMGLFHVDDRARRRWIYPIIAMLIPVLIATGPFLYRSAFDVTQNATPNILSYYAETVPISSVYLSSDAIGSIEDLWSAFLLALGGVYFLSILDVVATCYARRAYYPGPGTIISRNPPKLTEWLLGLRDPRPRFRPIMVISSIGVAFIVLATISDSPNPSSLPVPPTSTPARPLSTLAVLIASPPVTTPELETRDCNFTNRSASYQCSCSGTTCTCHVMYSNGRVGVYAERSVFWVSYMAEQQNAACQLFPTEP